MHFLERVTNKKKIWIQVLYSNKVNLNQVRYTKDIQIVRNEEWFFVCIFFLISSALVHAYPNNPCISLQNSFNHKTEKKKGKSMGSLKNKIRFKASSLEVIIFLVVFYFSRSHRGARKREYTRGKNPSLYIWFTKVT